MLMKKKTQQTGGKVKNNPAPYQVQGCVMCCEHPVGVLTLKAKRCKFSAASGVFDWFEHKSTLNHLFLKTHSLLSQY